MKPVDIIFTGTVDDECIGKISKSYVDVKVKQFNLLKFSQAINKKNLKTYYNAIDESTIVCITSKKTIEIIMQYPDLVRVVSQKKIVVSGEKVAGFLRSEINTKGLFSKQYQGQRGVIDILLTIVTDNDSILYLHSNKAEKKITDFLESGNFIGQNKVLYETNYDEIASLKLLEYLKKNNTKHKIIFFASPSAVCAYKELIFSNDDNNIRYIAFGQSTWVACENFGIECFFDRNSKNYFDAIKAFLDASIH